MKVLYYVIYICTSNNLQLTENIPNNINLNHFSNFPVQNKLDYLNSYLHSNRESSDLMYRAKRRVVSNSKNSDYTREIFPEEATLDDLSFVLGMESHLQKSVFLEALIKKYLSDISNLSFEKIYNNCSHVAEEVEILINALKFMRLMEQYQRLIQNVNIEKIKVLTINSQSRTILVNKYFEEFNDKIEEHEILKKYMEQYDNKIKEYENEIKRCKKNITILKQNYVIKINSFYYKLKESLTFKNFFK
ncbi:hypothetical protein GVAV_000668 [Gurleya vavrai]